MKPNIGTLDCFIRIVLSMTLFGIGLKEESLIGLFGIVPLIVFFFQWSFVYYIIGINTFEEE
jgi:hypothetical protein